MILIIYILTPFTMTHSIHLFQGFRIIQTRMMVLTILHGLRPNPKLKSILEGRTDLQHLWGTTLHSHNLFSRQFFQPQSVYIRFTHIQNMQPKFYLGSAMHHTLDREYSRSRKYFQLTHERLVQAELALRYWHEHDNLYIWAPIPIYTDRVDYRSLEVALIQEWQPRLNYPFICQFYHPKKGLLKKPLLNSNAQFGLATLWRRAKRVGFSGFLFVNATKVILWKKPMWPCISFSDEKCSLKFNDLKTVSISDTVPKQNVKSALGSMKANGFQWFPNTNATHVLKKTACNVTHFFCNKSMRQNRCSPCYCGRAPLPWRCSNRSKSIYSLVCSTEPLFFLTKFAANAFPAHYLALLLVFYFGFGCCLFFSCRLCWGCIVPFPFSFCSRLKSLCRWLHFRWLACLFFFRGTVIFLPCFAFWRCRRACRIGSQLGQKTIFIQSFQNRFRPHVTFFHCAGAIRCFCLMGCGGTAGLFCRTSPLSLPWAGQGFNAGHSCESFFSEERLHWRDWLCEIC